MTSGNVQDLTLAELVVLFPDHDVKTVAESLQAARSNGFSELQNRDIFFNFCVDFLLNASPSSSSTSSPIVEEPAKRRRTADDIVIVKEQIDISHDQSSSTSSIDSITDTSTNGDYNAHAKSQLVIDVNKPGTSNANQDRAVIAEAKANADVQLDPMKIVGEEELGQYVAHVKDIFPNIETNWIRTCFVNRHTLASVIEWAVNNPGSIPKEKKLEKKKKSESNEPQTPSSASSSKVTGNYFIDINVEVDLRYRRSASVLLSQEFRRVRTTSLDQVLAYFNSHYAPAAKLVRDMLKNISAFDMRRVSNVAIESGPWSNIHGDKASTRKLPSYLILNRSIRPHRKDVLIPDDLKVEIEWLNEHLDDDWFQIIQGTGLDSTKDEASTNADNDMVKKLAMIEARENGDLYECIICCDEYLIFEMMPCAEGHLFCRNCLRNHAKEIVYGQAKAQITCLDNDCKARFSAETLKSALDTEWLSKLDERLREEEINKADLENLVKCIYCNYAIVMEASPEENKVFQCQNPECEKSFCRLCKEDWEDHVGKRCDEMESKDEAALRKKMEEKMAEAVIRICYSCKAKLVKHDGCNKITCRCGAKMCYICRKAISDYSHFCNHPRNPGQPCSKCTACSLWENPEVRDNQTINEIKGEAKAEQQTAGLKQTEIGAKVHVPTAIPHHATPMRAPRPLPLPPFFYPPPQQFAGVPRAVHDVLANLHEQLPVPIFRQGPMVEFLPGVNAYQTQAPRPYGQRRAPNPYYRNGNNYGNN